MPGNQPERMEGPATAALLAAGIGGFALGLLTVLAEASSAVKDHLTFSQSVGPLSGKTSYAVVVWLIAWGVLHLLWRRTPGRSRPVLIVAGALLALGALGTFPPLFQLFASG